MKTWLKGGLWGLFVGAIFYLTISFLLPGIVVLFADYPKEVICLSCLYDVSAWLLYLIGGFVIGGLIGWILEIRNIGGKELYKRIAIAIGIILLILLIKWILTPKIRIIT